VQTPEIADPDTLEEVLLSKDITVALASQDVEEKKVMSITWDMEVECRGCGKKKIDFPMVRISTFVNEKLLS
jgi:hypothetical protein